MQSSDTTFVLLPLLLMGLAFVVAILAFVFWIWMLVDCATKEPSQGNEKVVWILVIVFLHGLGALIYYFARRPQRIRQFGA